MGAVLAHSRSKKRTRLKISEQCLERFNRNKTDFCAFVDLLLCMRLGYTITRQIAKAVKTVDRSRLFSAKEDKVGFISGKGHGVGVLGC
jgi:hypothetical protein